jgi:hypothetical protein
VGEDQGGEGKEGEVGFTPLDLEFPKLNLGVRCVGHADRRSMHRSHSDLFKFLSE